MSEDSFSKMSEDSFSAMSEDPFSEMSEDPFSAMRSQETWSSLDHNNDSEVLEGSPLEDVLYHGAPSLHHCKGVGLSIRCLKVGPGPLGLQLRKSASLVNLVQMKLDQASRERTSTTSDGYRDVSDTYMAKPILKPSQFYASTLRIGTWEWKSRYDGDLVAKFYYTKCKLIWEILSKGLKRKIEIDWPTISSLTVNCPESEPGTLEIMLSRAPIFYQETNLKPRLNTKWMRTADFTGGQASMHRRHFLQCVPGILDKHIVKLLSSNHHLYSLSQKNINQQNPLFDHFHSECEVSESSRSIQDLYSGHNNHQFEQQQLGEPVSMSIEKNTVGKYHNGSQDIMHVLIPSSVPVPIENPTALSGDLRFRNMFSCNSPSAQTPPQAQLGASNVQMLNDTTNHMINPSKPPQRNALTSIGVPESNYDGMMPLNTRELGLFSNDALDNPRTLSSSSGAQLAATSLESISHDLLNDTEDTEPAYAVEKDVIMSRVSSFSSLLIQDPAPVTVHAACDPSVNIEVEAPAQVFDVAPPGSSGGSCSGGEGGNNGLVLSTNMEQEPMWDIEMDMAYLSELPLFSP